MMTDEELRLECLERAIRINPITMVVYSPEQPTQQGPAASKVVADATVFLAFVRAEGAQQSAPKRKTATRKVRRMTRVALALILAALCAAPSAEARPRHSWHDAGTMVAHPAGCPARAFCGCGVASYVFGRPVRSLWLASAWRRFPRAYAAPGMVAVWRGHVAAIIATHGDGTALVYDPNSGHHATRIHRRDIRRAVIVNPRA
jgi:hypothetical protein